MLNRTIKIFPHPRNRKPRIWQYIDNQRQRTIGVSYTSFVHVKTPTPGVFIAPTTDEFGFYRVVDPAHWIFEGTNLKEGDEFGREDSIVGVEADAADLEFLDGRPRYTGRDGVSTHYKILAIADAATGGPLEVGDQASGTQRGGRRLWDGGHQRNRVSRDRLQRRYGGVGPRPLPRRFRGFKNNAKRTQPPGSSSAVCFHSALRVERPKAL